MPMKSIYNYNSMSNESLNYATLCKEGMHPLFILIGTLIRVAKEYLHLMGEYVGLSTEYYSVLFAQYHRFIFEYVHLSYGDFRILELCGQILWRKLNAYGLILWKFISRHAYLYHAIKSKVRQYFATWFSSSMEFQGKTNISSNFHFVREYSLEQIPRPKSINFEVEELVAAIRDRQVKELGTAHRRRTAQPQPDLLPPFLRDFKNVDEFSKMKFYEDKPPTEKFPESYFHASTPPGSPMSICSSSSPIFISDSRSSSTTTTCPPSSRSSSSTIAASSPSFATYIPPSCSASPVVYQNSPVGSRSPSPIVPRFSSYRTAGSHHVPYYD